MESIFFLQNSRKFGSMNNPMGVMRSFNFLLIIIGCFEIVHMCIIHFCCIYCFLSTLSFDFAVLLSTLYWPMWIVNVFAHPYRQSIVLSLHRNFLWFLFMCSYTVYYAPCRLYHLPHKPLQVPIWMPTKHFTNESSYNIGINSIRLLQLQSLCIMCIQLKVGEV